MSFSDRLRRARELLPAAGADALLVSSGADLRYLTGLARNSRERLTCLVLPATADPVLVVPALELAVAQASPAGELGLPIVTWTETADPARLVASLLPPGVGTIAVGNSMEVAKALALRDAVPGARLVLGGPVLNRLRTRKEPAELDALRRAGAAIDRVHARMGEWLRPGRTEREVGADIARAIIAEGHQGQEWVVVGSGPNGASPHHALSDRVIEAGDPVVVDIGGTTADGYCSDSTRTYVVAGPPDPEFAACYEVLRTAQEAAVAAVRPGVLAASVDRAARSVITDAGYGDAFFHRTGHGIGLETHEDPYVVEGSKVVLEPGMTFSVEPGIYLTGRYGARIEDIVAVTEDGVERLNRRPRALVTL